MATLVLAAAGSALGAGFGGSILGLTGAAIGQAAGSLLGSMIDSALVASFAPNQSQQGARLESLRVTSSSEGVVIPKLYGRMRLGGNLIWATDFLETVSTTTSGGGKGHGGQVSTTTYSYSASFAVALCEGQIAGVTRIWADGDPMDLSDVTWRVYVGSEAQTADPFITMKMGAAPAYRGTAYVVFEGLDLTKFGNRIPQVEFEIIRALGDAETLITGANLLPGAGEFVTATTLVTTTDQNGTSVAINQHGTTKTDLRISLDDLETVAPNIGMINLIASWFGTDLRAEFCRIKPGVETATKSTSTDWGVNGIARGGAYVVSQISGAAAFGGTPADFAIVEAIAEATARGLAVTFVPFVTMDIWAGNARPNPYSNGAASVGQAVYPWRGRITVSPAPGYTGTVDKTATAATQVSAFFGAAAASDLSVSGTTVTWTGSPTEWGYRRMVLHYAKLCAAAGGVHSFVIGSELKGLTTARSAAGTFPVVAALITLAADVRAILPAAKISYAADWSEYFGHQPADGTGDVYYHLDPLWSDANVDFVGIDAYFPLADWRAGDTHTDLLAGYAGPYDLTYLRANIEAGEGFTWYYANLSARNAQTRTTISDGAYGKPWVFRPKDIRSFWGNTHKNRPAGVESGSATGWIAQSKPIRFIEYGCPAVDKGANQPNVFVDAKSSESALPFYSTGSRDDLAQRRYIEALIGYWANTANNPASGVYSGRMVDTANSCVWAWDARPYPAFPTLSAVWGDTANWVTGHWLNGRLGSSIISLLLQDLVVKAGLQTSDVDVSKIAESIPGFVISGLDAARSTIETLSRYFGFDAVETEGVIRFVPRGAAPAISIDETAFVAGGDEDATYTRGQETELPKALKWRLLSASDDYKAVTVEARRITAESSRVAAEQFALAHDPAKADAQVRRALAESWIGRETATFALPPSWLRVDPGDVVEVLRDGRYLQFGINRIADQEARALELIRRDRTVYEFADGPARGVTGTASVVYGSPAVALLDLPQLTDDAVPYRPWAAVAAAPWYGTAAIWRSPASDGFTLHATASLPAQMGITQSPLNAGPLYLLDLANSLTMSLSSGTLFSVTDTALLGGANIIAVETLSGVWECLQFGTATLIAPGIWKLSRLLRGQLGTEDAMQPSLAAGARVVILDAALVPLPMQQSEIGLAFNYRIGPGNRAAGDTINNALTFTGRGRGLRPFSPVRIKGIWASGDIAVSWLRRSRSIAADLWNDDDVPLGETAESYAIDVMNGASVIRTATISVATWTYTAAMQTADFGSLQTTVSVKVYQIGQLGRGPAGSAILS